MEKKPRIFYLRRFHERPRKAYITSVGANVLREIISYLTQTEFISLCLSCHKFSRYFRDKYIRFALPDTEPNLKEGPQTGDAKYLFETKAALYLQISLYPAISIEWKTYPMAFFHYVINNAKTLVFLYHDNVFGIKATNSYSTEFNSVFSREFQDKIISARGYKNRVLLIFSTYLIHLVLSAHDLQSSDLHSTSIILTYSYSTKHHPKEVLHLNKGKHIIVGYTNEVHILEEDMTLLEIRSNLEKDYRLIVPNQEGRTYIIQLKKEIIIHKVETQQEIKIEQTDSITDVKTTRFHDRPYVVYCDYAGYLYVNNTKIQDIRSKGDFMVFNEYIVFKDIDYRIGLVIYNLLKHKIVYTLNIPSSEFVSIFDFSDYKLMYFVGHNLVLHSFITQKAHTIFVPFEELTYIRHSSPYIFMAGKSYINFGFMAINFSRAMPLQEYQIAVDPPLHRPPPPVIVQDPNERTEEREQDWD